MSDTGNHRTTANTVTAAAVATNPTAPSSSSSLRRTKRHAPAIVSPTNGKPRVVGTTTATTAGSTTTTMPAPPMITATTATPTLYVHILFDGVLANDTSAAKSTTCTTPPTMNHAGAGAGALVTIISIPSQNTDAKDNNNNNDSDNSNNNNSIKSYRIRQYYGNHQTTLTTNEPSPLNQYSMYYVALTAALRVVLKHMRDIQPPPPTPTKRRGAPRVRRRTIPRCPAPRSGPSSSSSSSSSFFSSSSSSLQPPSPPPPPPPPYYQIRNVQRRVASLKPPTPSPPPPPYYQIRNVQIEGSCSRLIMDTIQFLSRHPITATSYAQRGFTIDPLLKQQFDTCHILLRQLSKYYYTTTTTTTTATGGNSSTASRRGNNNNKYDHSMMNVLGMARIEPEWNVIPRALSQEAIQAQRSWMTTSDDYHTQSYPLPTTIIESL